MTLHNQARQCNHSVHVRLQTYRTQFLHVFTTGILYVRKDLNSTYYGTSISFMIYTKIQKEKDIFKELCASSIGTSFLLLSQ